MRTFWLGLLMPLAALAQDANPLTAAIQTRYRSAKRNLTGSAEAMPEDAYGFRLTPPQRTFGGWIAHTAGGNYFFCSAFGGRAKPDTAGIEKMTAKADLVKALRDSFVYCDQALASMDDKKAMGEITMAGKKAIAASPMIGLLISLNEHYGNLVGYLRTKGVTPPSSAHPHK